MNETLKKLIGLLFILISLPLFFGLIWAVGVTRSLSSPALTTEVPQQIVSDLPDLIDVTFEEAQKPGAITDPNAKTWMDAVAKVKTTPRELFETIGIFSWLETELTSSLSQMGKAIRGEASPNTVSLNTLLLKKALLSIETEEYVKNIFSNLPDCTVLQRQMWIDQIGKAEKAEDLPACDPGTSVTNFILEAVQTNVSQVPDTVPLINDFQKMYPVNIAGLVQGITWTSFVFPALFLLVGVFLLSDKLRDRTRIAALVIFLAAFGVFVTAQMAQKGGLIGLSVNPATYRYDTTSFYSADLHQFVINRMGDTIANVLTIVFNPVIGTSEIIMLISALVFGASFFIPQQAYQTVSQGEVADHVSNSKPKSAKKRTLNKKSTRKPQKTKKK